MLLLPSSGITVAAATYILFEIILALANIIFVGKFEELQAPPASIERSIILLLFNLVEVVLIFAVFYKSALGLSPGNALFQASLVSGQLVIPTT